MTEPVEAVVVIDPGGRVVALGALTDAERVTLEQQIDAQQPQTLPHTGAYHRRIVGAGLLLIVVGAILVQIADRPRRAPRL